MKQRIRINERQLRQIVAESAKRVLKEEEFGNDFLSLLASVADEMPYWGYDNESVVLENFLNIIEEYPEKMRTANPKITSIIKNVLADAENKYENGGNNWDDFDDFINTLKQLDNAFPKAVFAARKEYGNLNSFYESKSNKQIIRISENQLRQIVSEAVKRMLKEGVGDEYLDVNDKRYDRTIRFDGVKRNQDELDRANSDRLIHHRKSRGVKTKGDLSSRDFWRQQTEKGNPLIKYKRNPKEWLDNLMSQSDD